jgi:predicted GIY-YIG superfamily endonuclease
MKKHYVYELINLYGTIEDVGETTRLKTRMCEHTKKKPGHGNGKFYGRQDLIMNVVAEFDTRKEALELEGKLKLEYGIPWSERERGMVGGKTNNKEVLVYKIDGSYIGEYTSVTEASLKLNLSAGNISRVCKGQLNHTKGYTFKYA